MTTSAPSSRPFRPGRRSRLARRAALRTSRASAPRRPRNALLTAVLCFALVAVAACGSGGAQPVYQDATPQAQMQFGVEMAQRGLWNEALFRFQRAQSLSPGDPQVLNNLAVAYEATGQFDEALDAYQRALQSSPENRELRRNYARFVEFYQSYRPQEAATAGDGEATGAQPAGDAGQGGDGGRSLSRSMTAQSLTALDR